MHVAKLLVGVVPMVFFANAAIALPPPLECKVAGQTKYFRNGIIVKRETLGEMDNRISFVSNALASIWGAAPGYEGYTHQYSYAVTPEFYTLDWLDKPDFVTSARITLNRLNWGYQEKMIVNAGKDITIDQDTTLVTEFNGFCGLLNVTPKF